MREIVIVIPDLYLDPSPEDSRASPGDAPPGAGVLGTLPGFERAARFGTRRSIAPGGGWRPWLSRWLSRPDLASHAPATIAAAALSPPNFVATAEAPRAPSTVWMATPVHWIAGLTSLHLDRRGLLSLPSEDLAAFAADFNQTFGDTDLHLQPLSNGEFLLHGPAAWSAVTTEPARAVVTDLESSLPKGDAGSALKRLGAELEMWLHSHPRNEVRRRRGDRPVSALWFWGGGQSGPVKASASLPTDLAFGCDPYVAGLWRLQGSSSRPLPDRFVELLGDPKAERAILVVEVTPLLQSNSHWTVFEALVDVDRLYLSPALAALQARALESAVVVANDMEVRLRRGDRLKIWRRVRSGISAIL